MGQTAFATTRWSLVLAAASSSPASRKALGELCAAYWYPLYAFARRRGSSAEDAADLVQGFFGRILEREDLQSVSASRGRFRSWLLASLKHYLSNEWDRERTQKRGGGAQVVPLDFGDAEARYSQEPAAIAEADRLYERRWALALLQRALSRLEAENAEGEKRQLFDALKSALAGQVSPRNTELAAALGKTEGAVKVAAHRLRLRFRELLRAEIADTVEDPADIDDELRAFLAAVA